MQLYDFEDGEVRRFLRQHSARRVAVQLPEGLRRYLPQISRVFEGEGAEVLVLADSCYGACDLADSKAKQLGYDALVHYGHADMDLPTCLPTLFVEAHMTVDPLKAVEVALPSLGFERVGLVTNVQHIHKLQSVADLLRASGVEAMIGTPGPRAKYPGQVLGCDWGSARSIVDGVDGFLYVGTGRFHPLGVALATGKDVVAVNPVAGGFERLASSEDFLRRRGAVISRAAACDEFGVLVSTKPGQARFGLAARVAEALRRAGRTPRMLVVDEVVPERLADFTAGAFVCCACPRIPIDDVMRFDKPVLTPFELRVMLGEADFEPYELDEARLSDFGTSS